MIRTQLLTKGCENGYLRKNDSAMIFHPVFPTANLAIRKETIREVGSFDTACKTSGEDVDLCIRTAKTKWELYFEPRAIVRHKHRTTFRGLIKQWYNYGTQHPPIFKKHTPKCMEIYYASRKNESGWVPIRFYKIFGVPLSVHILIFLTSFYIFNIFLFLMFFALAIKSVILGVVSLAGWLLGWLYFSWQKRFRNITAKRNPRWLIYMLIRYVLNWAYVLGSFFTGLKIGVLYFDVTREWSPVDTE